MKIKRNLSGVYFRSKNIETGKWENVCFEELPKDEQHTILSLKDKKWLICMVNILSDTINDIGEQFNIAKG